MLPKVESDFEQRLVDALRPVRYFALAQALFHFVDTGIHNVLTRGPAGVEELAGELGMNPHRLRGFLLYLLNEGYLREDGERFALTAKAEEMAVFHPWYRLIVGGYAETFQQLGWALTANGEYATRRGADVGAGSCGMSRYDALPLVLRLLEPIRATVRTIVDLGCGSGHTLADLMDEMPALRAIGVDPEPASVRAARELMAERDLGQRVDLRVAGVEDVMSLSVDDGAACFLTAFVLQELLEQKGRGFVVDLMAKVLAANPGAHWVVIEVDDALASRDRMAHRLAQSYYNPYFLIHHLTEQRLEPLAFWEELFEEAGATVLARLSTDPRVDSTGFEQGYLLRAAGNGRDAR
jgi:2-ketoarginine methyltransferase